MQRALESWIACRHNRPPHVEILSAIVAFLAVRAEQATSQRWIDHPFTAQAIVAGLNEILAKYGLDDAAEPPPELFAAFEGARKLKSTPKELGGAIARVLSMFIILAGMESDQLAKLGLPKSGARPSDPEAAAIFESWGHDRTFRTFRTPGSRTKLVIDALKEVLKRRLQT
jgi:hypothetical protein